MDAVLESLKLRPPNPNSDYLMDVDDPELHNVVDSMSLPTNPSERLLKWPPRHEELFKSIGCPGRPGLAQLAAFKSSLHEDIRRAMWDRLRRRQPEIVVFFSVLWAKDVGECEWAIDTSQNLWRLCKAPNPDVISCLTGTSKIWLVKSQRLLIGEECMALQGITRMYSACWSCFDNMLLWSLAGNAFAGNVASVVFYAGVSSTAMV